MGISTAELTSMRAEAARYLPSTCTIQRLGTSAGRQSWSTSSSNVACRLDILKAPTTPSGAPSFDNSTVDKPEYWLYLALTADLRKTDRVVIGSTTYVVTAITETQSWNIMQRAKLTEL